MKTTLTATLAAGLLVLAACGDDDDGASGVQGEAASQAIEAAQAEGLALDEGCVNDLAAQLSDEDAQAIIDAGPDGDADLSPEGQALTAELLTCVDQDELIDVFIQGLEESGQEVDENCVRENLEGVDLSSALGSEDEPPAELINAVFECVELDLGE